MESTLAVHGCLVNRQGWVVDAGLVLQVPGDGVYVSRGSRLDGHYRTDGMSVLPVPPLAVN